MSTTSIVGLAGVSKKKTLVFGRIAAFHWSRSRPSTAVHSMPKRGRRLSVTQRVGPKAARATTMWSPTESWQSIAELIAAMPLAWVRQASAPSSRAMRSSSICTEGFWVRE